MKRLKLVLLISIVLLSVVMTSCDDIQVVQRQADDVFSNESQAVSKENTDEDLSIKDKLLEIDIDSIQDPFKRACYKTVFMEYWTVDSVDKTSTVVSAAGYDAVSNTEMVSKTQNKGGDWTIDIHTTSSTESDMPALSQSATVEYSNMTLLETDTGYDMYFVTDGDSAKGHVDKDALATDYMSMRLQYANPLFGLDDFNNVVTSQNGDVTHYVCTDMKEDSAFNKLEKLFGENINIDIDSYKLEFGINPDETINYLKTSYTIDMSIANEYSGVVGYSIISSDNYLNYDEVNVEVPSSWDSQNSMEYDAEQSKALFELRFKIIEGIEEAFAEM